MDLDTGFLAECLGAMVVSDPDAMTVRLRLANLSLGVRLKLDIDRETSGIRLNIDRTGRTLPNVIGTVRVERVQSVLINSVRGEVRFVGEHFDIVVTKSGTFRVTTT